MTKLTTNGKPINLYWKTGTVINTSKTSTTQVHGGGSVHQGTGSISVSSTSTIHDQIFIKDIDGNEKSYKLSGFDVACREGNEITVMWAIKEGKEEGPYIAVLNHSTSRNFFNLKQFATLFEPRPPLYMMIINLFIIALSFVVAWQCIFALLIMGGVWNTTKKKLKMKSAKEFTDNLNFEEIKRDYKK